MTDGTDRLWRISDFDVGPHWCAVIVRAESAEAAKADLAAKIGTDEGGYPDTVWELCAQDEWRVTEVDAGDPVVFLLGSGCRG